MICKVIDFFMETLYSFLVSNEFNFDVKGKYFNNPFNQFNSLWLGGQLEILGNVPHLSIVLHRLLESIRD